MRDSYTDKVSETRQKLLSIENFTTGHHNVRNVPAMSALIFTDTAQFFVAIGAFGCDFSTVHVRISYDRAQK